MPLAKSRLDRLVHHVAHLYRKAHLTAEEARYVLKRARRLLGLREGPERRHRLPETLNPDELRRILAQAYQDRGSYGLIVRALFETGLRVSEFVSGEVGDVDFTERTIRVRQGKGAIAGAGARLRPTRRPGPGPAPGFAGQTQAGRTPAAPAEVAEVALIVPMRRDGVSVQQPA
jgi:integrase